MIILEDQSDAGYQIRAYEPGKIRINETDFNCSIIVAAEHLIPDWGPQTLAELKPEHWQPVLSLKPEVIVFGTGNKFIMPKAELLAPLYEQQLGVESMDTSAACRTYIALMSEGRNVVAALLIK